MVAVVENDKAKTPAAVAVVEIEPPAVKSTAELLKLVANLDAWIRITPTPLPMDKQVETLCLGMPDAKSNDHRALLSSHNATFNIFVTPDGAIGFKTRQSIFSIGSIVLKQKITANEVGFRSPALYTGMLKREKGYNPECGDWEFFTVGGDVDTIRQRGKLSRCMDCHKNYTSSDFITKEYLFLFLGR